MKRCIACAVVLVSALACGGVTESSSPSGTGGAAAAGGTSGTGAASTGGASGSSAGGSGGVSSGGAAGSSGTSGASGTGGSGPECTDSSQCTLFSDCCTCTALGPNEPPPPNCFAACDQDACSAQGLTTNAAQCAAGQCVIGFDCTSPVFCNALPPECPPGQVPSVANGCWGSCVDATQCTSVKSCSDCGGHACVMNDMQGAEIPTQVHCVEVPVPCDSSSLCGCMGASVCTSPYTACVDLSGVYGVVCSCPNC